MTIIHRLKRWLRSHVHKHDWHYSPTTIAGWGVVRCRICGETDIYA